MAVKKVNESVDAPEIKRFIGGTCAKVLACNPTMEGRNALLGINFDKEPVYVSEREIDGTKYPQALITVYTQPDYVIANDNNGEEIKPVIPVTFFITKNHRFNSDKTKIQVIDKYGYSGWATQAELQNHTPLLSKNGKALRITTSYRPAYEGEIEFVEWVKNYLCIDEALSYVNEEWTSNPKVQDIEECEIYYDIEKFFKGDFSEIQGDLKLAPENEFKAAYGVRTDNKGQMFQMMYTRKTARKSSRFFEIVNSIKDAKKNGALSNVDIDVNTFRVYDVKATNLSQPNNLGIPASPNPFAAPSAPAAGIATPQATPWG